MKTKFASALVLAALITACARPAREVKAPCGPLSAYAKEHCGAAKPVNAAFQTVLVE